MSLRTNSIDKSRYFLIYLSLASIVPIVFVSIRSSVDLYHEGAIFPSSVGVSHGNAIFREVNNQYGFLVALVNSPFIKLFGNYVIISRLVGYLVYILVVICYFLIVKRVANKFIAAFSSLILVTINPAWSLLAQNDMLGLSVWVNVYGVLLILFSIVIVFCGIDNPRKISKLFAIAGAVSFLSVFVRPQFVFVWLLQLIYLSIRFRSTPARKTPAINWFLGGMTSLLFSITYLLSQGALNDCFDQLVKVWFENAPNSAYLGLGNLLNFTFSSSLFFVCFTIMYLSLKIFGSKIIGIILVVLFIEINASFLDSASDFMLMGRKIGPFLSTAMQGLLFSFCSALVSLLILVIVFSFLSNFNIFRAAKTFSLFNSGDKSNFLLVSSLGTLFQLHNVNSAYIFMVIPIIMAWFIAYVFGTGVNTSFRKMQLVPAVYIVLSVFIGFSIATSYVLANKPFYPYKSYILQGLKDTNPIARNKIDANFNVLEMNVKNGQMFMDCQYGLYSVSPSGLYVANRWTWSEIPAEWRLNSLAEAKPGNFLLRCGGDIDTDAQYATWVKSLAIVLIQENSNFLLYKINKSLVTH